MRKPALDIYAEELQKIKEAGTWKEERVITTPQRAHIETDKGLKVINMCANNYLGLGDNQEIIEAAKASYDQTGYGVASVRFICGTQFTHKELEKSIRNIYFYKIHSH